MPLTKEERAFLDAYVFEATHEPFGGPATDDLRRRGIYYTDVHWLLTAYDRELCAEKILPFGQANPDPPPSPWADLEHAKTRNQVLQREYEDRNSSVGNAKPVATGTQANAADLYHLPGK